MEIWKNIAVFSWALPLQSQTQRNKVLSPIQNVIRFTFNLAPWKERSVKKEQRTECRAWNWTSHLAPGSRSPPPPLSLSLSLSLVFPTIVVHQVNEASQKLIRSINPFQRFSSLSARHAPMPDSTLGGKGLATFGDIPDARWCSYWMLVNMFLLI